MFYGIPLNVAVFHLAKTRKINVSTATIILSIAPMFLIGWYVNVTNQFFKDANDCRKNASALWMGHIIILVEAMLMFFGCAVI